MLSSKLPVYTKTAYVLLSICAVTYILYIGQDIIIPLVLSAFFTVLLNPLVGWCKRRGMSRVVAIFLVVSLTFILFTALIYFILSQLSMFVESMPLIEKKFTALFMDCVGWCSRVLGVKSDSILGWLSQSKDNMLRDGASYISATIGTLSEILVLVCIVPVYVLMMLYYEPLFMEFIERVSPRNQQLTLGEVLLETKSVLQSYLAGLLVEALIVSAMNCGALMLLDVEYAVLWGIIGAILNLIPYIGLVIAVIFPVMISILTNDSYSTALLVVIAYMVIQFIDNNIIVPKIVASRVKINALVSVVVVLIGGSLWGISGMFLSIPITAVVKIVFDRVNVLKPYGFLIGDTMPRTENRLQRLLRLKLNKKAPEAQPE